MTPNLLRHSRLDVFDVWIDVFFGHGTTVRPDTTTNNTTAAEFRNESAEIALLTTLTCGEDCNDSGKSRFAGSAIGKRTDDS